MPILDFGEAAERGFRWQVSVPDQGQMPSLFVEIDEADLSKSPREVTTPTFLHGLLRFLGLIEKPDFSVHQAVVNTPEARPAVTVELPNLPWIKKYEDDIPTLLVIWIQERREWIAVMHRQFTIPLQGPSFSYRGPFELNSLCKKALARAYDIREVPDNIEHLSPEKLAKGGV